MPRALAIMKTHNVLIVCPSEDTARFSSLIPRPNSSKGEKEVPKQEGGRRGDLGYIPRYRSVHDTHDQMAKGSKVVYIAYAPRYLYLN